MRKKKSKKKEGYVSVITIYNLIKKTETTIVNGDWDNPFMVKPILTDKLPRHVVNFRPFKQ